MARDRLALARPSPARAGGPGTATLDEGVDPVVGGVLVHGELFEDDLALALHVVVAQRRRREHVAEELEARGRRPTAGSRV